jgi:PAS domain-containing protein
MENLVKNEHRGEPATWETIPVTPAHVLDLLPDFVGVADPGGRWQFINRPGREMVGLREGDSASDFRIHDFFPNWGIARLEPSGDSADAVDWDPNGRLRTREGRDVQIAHAVIAHTNEHSEIECFTIIARGAFSPSPARRAAERIVLDAAARECLAEVHKSLNGSVDIVESFESDNAAVFADPTQIRHMVMNLCFGSAQSMREGGGVIDVNTSRVAIKGPSEPGGTALRAGSYVRLTIRDNGPGIEPALAPHVFDPVGEGREWGPNGIGLWNVRRAVIDTGGDIFVETAPGRGTAFHIYMPIVGTNGNGSVS